LDGPVGRQVTGRKPTLHDIPSKYPPTAELSGLRIAEPGLPERSVVRKSASANCWRRANQRASQRIIILLHGTMLTDHGANKELKSGSLAPPLPTRAARRQRLALQPCAAKRSGAASAESACWSGFFSFFVTHNNFKKSSTSSRASFKICTNVERLTGRWAGTVILSTSLPMRFCNRM
jgi:hypothetical protein